MCDIRLIDDRRHAARLGLIRFNIGPPSTRTSITIRSPRFCARRSSALARRAQHLLQQPRAAVRLVTQDVQGIVGELAANQVRQRGGPCGH